MPEYHDPKTTGEPEIGLYDPARDYVDEQDCTCTVACIPQGLTEGQVCRERRSSEARDDACRRYVSVRDYPR